MAVVTGGSEAALTPLSRAAFARAGRHLGERRVAAVRPHVATASCMGEGAAVLVLEDGEAARARGARILARARGYGATCDAFHLTAPDEAGSGQARPSRRRCATRRVAAEAIDYVNAHGTSTPLNDRAETIALKRALGAHAHEIPVSSTKSAIGHLLGAAGRGGGGGDDPGAARPGGAARRSATSEADPELDLDFVPDTARPLALPDGKRPIALSNSFGFGGHNAVLCLEGV